MKGRPNIAASIILFGLATAAGFMAVVLTGTYALKELKVGGPIYSEIKLGNDLVADILPPPEYVLEAFLEATLALKKPATLKAREGRLIQLHKDYDERRAFWVKSDLNPTLKSMLTETSDTSVQQFWKAIEVGFTAHSLSSSYESCGTANSRRGKWI